MSGTTTGWPASTRRGATSYQVDPVRGWPWISSTGGPSPAWRTRSSSCPPSMRSSWKFSTTGWNLVLELLLRQRAVTLVDHGVPRLGLYDGRDQHRADPVATALDLLGLEQPPVDLDRRAGDRDLAEVLGHQATDGVDLVVLEGTAEDLVEV